MADMLGRGIKETSDVTARREIAPLGAQDNNPDPIVRVQFLESHPQLVPLPHPNDVHRRARQNDVAALAVRVDLDPEPVKVA
jgi:hypothetical protein